MFSRNREEDLEQAKEKARMEMEKERQKVEMERQKLEAEREKLEQLRRELDRREDKLEEMEDQLEDFEDELEDQEDELEDAESIRDLLDVVSEKIPSLMRGIDDALISPEVMKKKAESLAIYYKTLIDAGMDKNTAESMALVQASEMNHMVQGYGKAHIHPRRPHPPVRPAHPTPPTPPKRADDFHPSRQGE